MHSVLQEKIRQYYQKYYRDDCSLADWQKRSEDRLNEESHAATILSRLFLIYPKSFREMTCCIVGAGTAGLASVLKKEYNSDVYGVEPSPEAMEIIHDRCREDGIPIDRFRKEYAESMSFADDFFDVVFCHTVLEHVRSVDESLDEMLRILKPGGLLYLNTPNYQFPHERHYKIFFPTFLPKCFGRLYLRLRGKNPDFLNSLQFVTEKTINTFLIKKEDVVWLRVYEGKKKNGSRFIQRLYDFFLFQLFVYPNQELIIRKKI